MEYYKYDVNDVLDSLNTSLDGLSDEDASVRLIKNGLNKLDEGKKKTFLSRFFDQLKDIMIIVLLVAAILSFVVSIYEGESYVDAIIILIVVLLNAILGVLQETKADKAIDALQKMNSSFIKVKRNAKIKSIKTEELVMGDIILLEAGDYVPADARVLSSFSLKINESSLTGESDSVLKNFSKLLDKEYSLGDRINMVYSGSSVVYGRGEAVITSTGMNTELGKIATVITSMKDEDTPLQRKMNNLSKTLSIFVVMIAMIMFVIGVIQGDSIIDVFMLAVALCVAAIPEGLAAVITISLAIGVQNMSKKNSIVRKLSAVEALGCTEVICSDKTGTLTQNKMIVKKVYYDSEIKEGVISDKLKDIMILCNDSKISDKEILGDPTETALFDYCKNLETDIFLFLKNNKRVNELPFDSDRKMMSTIDKINDDYFMHTKGSLESVLEKCTKILIDGKVKKITDKEKKEIFDVNNELSSSAYRVLSFAYKSVLEVDINNPLEDELIFVGLCAMIDPPREEVSAAVLECFNAGMIPVMITGDNLNTAIAIAREIGIYKDGNDAITGLELDKLSDDELKIKLENIRVYARVSPENKIRIVQAFKSIGKTVAMTGDGVNDAPAIKGADIGIGMGITGTDVSKNVSSMVLADDNFATIIDAVSEGRRIYNNIENAITYLLASNLCEIIIIFFGMFFIIDGNYILLPVQILWINLISDTLPALALAFEKSDYNIMKKKPRKKDEPFFNKFTSSRIIVSALIKSLMVIIVYVYLSGVYNHSVAASSIFIILSIVEILYALSCRSSNKSLIEIGIFSNKKMFICVIGTIFLQIIMLSNSLTRGWLGVTDINSYIYFLIFACIIITFLLLELSKIIIAKIYKKI